MVDFSEETASKSTRTRQKLNFITLSKVKENLRFRKDRVKRGVFD